MPSSYFFAVRVAAILVSATASSLTHAAAILSVSDAVILPSSSQRSLPFVVSRSGDLGFDVTVHYATHDGSALAGRDYRASSGTVTILAGRTSATVDVPLLPVVAREPRSLTITLSDAVPGKQGVRAWGLAGTAAAAGGFPEGSVVADFNGDGKPDIAFPSIDSNNVSVIRNDTARGATSGNFTVAAVLSATSSPSRPAAGDLNGDGKPDLVIPNLDNATIDIYTNTTPAYASTFTFSHSQITSPAAGPIQALLADIDGDGRLDIVLSGLISGKVVVLLNRTIAGAQAPTFAAPAVFDIAPSDSHPYIYAMTTLDVDGDGKPDLAVSNMTNSEIVILRNTTVRGSSTPTFASPVAFPISDGATSIAAADIDRDGRVDLVTANNGFGDTGSTWSVLMNRTVPGSSTPNFSVTSQVGPAPYAAVLKDIDGDGIPDLVFAAFTRFDGNPGNGLAVYLNRTVKGAAKADFLEYAFIPTDIAGGSLPHTLLVEDFNGDGQQDFATMNFYFSNVAQFFFALPLVNNPNPEAHILNQRATGTIKPHFGLLP